MESAACSVGVEFCNSVAGWTCDVKDLRRGDGELRRGKVLEEEEEEEEVAPVGFRLVMVMIMNMTEAVYATVRFGGIVRVSVNGRS